MSDTDLYLDVGTLKVSSATYGTLYIGSSGLVEASTGGGTLTFAAITNDGANGAGTVEANGTTLILNGNIGASTGLDFLISNSTNSLLQIDGTVGSGNTFTFAGTQGVLDFNNAGTVVTTIDGLDVQNGSSSAPTLDYIELSGSLTVNNVAYSTDGATVTLSDGDVLTLTNVGTAIAGSGGGGGVSWYVNSTIVGGNTDVFLSDTPCFAAGTRILTASGERMVESLLPGDIVLTLADGALNAQPVTWVGRRRIDLIAHPRPETVAPVRIQRGAFADATPHRDLLVSPDHAIFVNGKLICARQLINGTTIRQEQGWTSVVYFHVELDAHAILLAEGLPAESYLDTGNRGFFANSGAPLLLHPNLTDETDYAARAAGSCAPFVSDEANVRPVWQRLAERAAALGQPAAALETTADAELRIVAKGRTLRPLYGENGLHIFALPKGATEVRVVSRAGAPADTRPWLDDRRRLGVCVERIVLRDAHEVREVPVNHPGLAQGWWAVERNGTALWRWTDGDAVLTLPASDGPAMLEIRAGNGGMTYLIGVDEGRQAA